MGTSASDRRHGFRGGDLFAAALDAVIVMDARGRIVDWNPAASRTFGYEREQALGQELAALVIPRPLRKAHRNALRRYLHTGEATILGRRVELTGLRRDGTEFPLELAVTRIPDSQPPLFAGFVRDLGELDHARRENTRLQQRMAFLAQVGLELERSLDVRATLHGLADLTIPELAELTVIDMIADDGSVAFTVAASSAPGAAARVRAVREREPIEADGRHPVAEVLRTGAPLLIPSISAELRSRFAQGPHHLTLIQELGYRSAIVVPLVARHRARGVLSLLRMDGSPPYDRDDLVLTVELARRAALAVDNARLFETTRDLARTLQQSLLPRRLPEVPGVRLTARYRAAAQGQLVGGDFYDVFSIGSSHWGITIGDVCGKGPEAAALTSLARYTMRALAGLEPTSVLELLGEAVVRDRDTLPERFLTVAFAVAHWEAGAFVLELASAGHPPPIVRRASGELERPRAAGPLLGISAGAEYRPARIGLAPGDSIVFYTDGLTDAQAPARTLTDADLETLVRSAGELQGAELAHFLEEGATGEADPRDDIAVLIVEVLRR
jgi:PAS domain S-box-containing protein